MDGKGTTILIAEDNEVSLKLAKKILERLNFNVIEAVNGFEAIKAVETNDILLVLMDLQMPLLDGFEATRIIRKTEKGKLIPIIALTAYATGEDKKKCLNTGMDDYISKPFKVEELERVIKNVSKRTKTF